MKRIRQAVLWVAFLVCAVGLAAGVRWCQIAIQDAGQVTVGDHAGRQL